MHVGIIIFVNSAVIGYVRKYLLHLIYFKCLFKHANNNFKFFLDAMKEQEKNLVFL